MLINSSPYWLITHLEFIRFSGPTLRCCCSLHRAMILLHRICLFFSECVWYELHVGECLLFLGRKRFTCRLCKPCLKCRKWLRGKGCGWGSCRPLMRKPGSWSKLPFFWVPCALRCLTVLSKNSLKKSRSQNQGAHDHLCLHSPAPPNKIPEPEIGCQVLFTSGVQACVKANWKVGRLLVMKMWAGSKGNHIGCWLLDLSHQEVEQTALQFSLSSLLFPLFDKVLWKKQLKGERPALAHYLRVQSIRVKS